MNDIPNAPGSPSAVALGCLCDPERNRHGHGWYGLYSGVPVFWVHCGCGLHGAQASLQSSQALQWSQMPAYGLAGGAA